VARTIVSAPEAVTAALDEQELLRRFDISVAATPWIYRWGLRALLWAIEWLPICWYGRRFTGLAPTEALRWLEKWADNSWSPLRVAFRGLATVVKLAFWSQRAVQRQISVPVERLDHVVPARPTGLRADHVMAAPRRDTEISCEVVVVGSGAGGAVVAAELAERGIDVVLLEEGHADPAHQLCKEPYAATAAMYREGGATMTIGSPFIPMPWGRTLGGTTTINSGTCFRLGSTVREKWRDWGLPLADLELDRYYARVEERISVREIPPELLGGTSAVIKRGAEKLGLSHRPLHRNIRGCNKSSVCAFGCPTQGKRSMGVTYVPAALEAGARLYTGVKALSAIRQHGQAVGVVARVLAGKATLKVRAKIVVCACGSVPSVSFLSASGVRSPHLGRHLTIHPASRVMALMPEMVDGWNDTPQGYLVDTLADQGVMLEGSFVPPEVAAMSLSLIGPKQAEVMAQFRHLAIYGFLVSDGPNGRVFATPFGGQLIFYHLADNEVEKVKKGLALLAEIFFAAGAHTIFLPIAGRETQTSLAAARQAIGEPFAPSQLDLSAFHPLGTARMAARRDHGVINPDLECWGIDNLFVVDGSIFPSSLGVNPQLTIMAYATRAAEYLAHRLRHGAD
jgi:choline dehydrogenase-like flavoprotein